MTRKFRIIRAIVPTVAVAAIGTLVAVEVEHDRQVSEARSEILQQMEISPELSALAQSTAFVTVARDRAPTVTSTMPDGRVSNLAKSICAEISRGVPSPDLSIRHGKFGSEALALETSALVNAANLAYCPDSDLTYPLEAEAPSSIIERNNRR